MKKLLLWDIDGTLLWGGGGGERALEEAMQQVFGVSAKLDQIKYSGRTDRWIADAVFELAAIEKTENKLHEYLEAYLDHLAKELHKGDAHVYPGILDILEEANKRDDIHQGLLTGNLEEGAETKLSHFDLWHHFEFGAYATDSKIRNELGPVALKRAFEKTGSEFSSDQVFIIGDTPYDIECGKIIGAHTIAVATGFYPIEKLEPHSPSALFENFDDIEAFFTVIDALASGSRTETLEMQ